MKKVLKVIAVIAAICALAAGVYIAIKKLTDKKEPEYFDDNDFFECDNNLEIIEATPVEEPAEKEAEEPVDEAEAEAAQETAE